MLEYKQECNGPSDLPEDGPTHIGGWDLEFTSFIRNTPTQSIVVSVWVDGPLLSDKKNETSNGPLCLTWGPFTVSE